MFYTWICCHLSYYNRNPLNKTVKRLYPITATKVYLVFIYGKDFSISNARRDFFRILGSAWFYITFIALLMLYLFLMRHGELFQRIDYFSIYMDVMIALTGGGTLRYRNDMKKCFLLFDCWAPSL